MLHSHETYANELHKFFWSECSSTEKCLAEQLYTPSSIEKRTCEICERKAASQRTQIQDCSDDGHLQMLDLFAGGGGLGVGVTLKNRVRVVQALDISHSASATLK